MIDPRDTLEIRQQQLNRRTLMREAQSRLRAALREAEREARANANPSFRARFYAVRAKDTGLPGEPTARAHGAATAHERQWRVQQRLLRAGVRPDQITWD